MIDKALGIASGAHLVDQPGSEVHHPVDGDHAATVGVDAAGDRALESGAAAPFAPAQDAINLIVFEEFQKPRPRGQRLYF